MNVDVPMISEKVEHVLLHKMLKTELNSDDTSTRPWFVHNGGQTQTLTKAKLGLKYA
jgi:hypothetical protein